MDRRNFVRSLPLAAGVTLAVAQGVEGSAPAGRDKGSPKRTINPLGVQLYTVRDPMAQNVEGTLATIAEIGYQEVEFAGLHQTSAGEMRAILDRVGLRAVSSHQSLQDIRTAWPSVLDDAALMGQTHIVCPSIPASLRTLGGYRQVAGDFNRAGEAARARGIQFGYHNHDFEFEPMGREVPYDLLLERCDPELVAMQMDIFWLVDAGADPLAYFEAHPGRFQTVHVKDRTESGEMVAVGQGVIDFAAILGQTRQAGIQHVFVEHDQPGDPLGNIRTSFEHLAGL